MGLISKRINQRKTDQLAKPIRAECSLSPDSIAEEAKRVVDSWTPGRGFSGMWNEENYRYWLRQKSDGSRWIVCGRPHIINGTSRFDWDSDRAETVIWEAKLQVVAAEGGPERRVVQLRLERWKTRDGKMQFRKSFEGFRDQLFSGLTTADPSLEMLTADE